jgi:hypothetical protein
MYYDDIFYDTSHFTLDEKRTLIQRLFESDEVEIDCWWVDELRDGGQGGARVPVPLDESDILPLLKAEDDFSIIYRRGYEQYRTGLFRRWHLSIACSVLLPDVTQFLWVELNEKYVDQFTAGLRILTP